jgi:1,4-alpha-glucan branching enzyme
LPRRQVLEAAAADPQQRPRLTLGLSPTLLSLLADEELNRGFLPWLQLRIELLELTPPEGRTAAQHLGHSLAALVADWQHCQGKLLPRFRRLQGLGVLDLITCAATHGYLPLLRECPEAVGAQLITAVREHQRLLGQPPLGIWLPECAYYEGLDQVLVQNGLRYSVLDAHGLLHAVPRPRYGVYAPICSPAGVAFFGRDSNSTLPVWSASEGYPGDGAYREFHRDLGWDLSESQLADHGIRSSRPLGLKWHRVTSQTCELEHKAPYEPAAAALRVRQHAADYLAGRASQLHDLAASIERPPLLVAPFDAELFGHWWFEGPAFLAELFRQAPAAELRFTTLRETLEAELTLQLCRPSPSSWGRGGYHSYWLNEANGWVVGEWQRASRAMVRRVNRGVGSSEHRLWLIQAGRELLLARKSVWPAGRYSAIAGFVEPGEMLEDTVIRETREEVGVEVGELRYFGSQPWPFPHSLMVAFTAEYAGGPVRPDGVEIEEAAWFDAEALPRLPPSVSISRRLITTVAAELARQYPRSR